MDLKEGNIIQLGDISQEALMGGVLISNMGYLMSQQGRSKGGRRDESEEKRAFAERSRDSLVFPILKKSHCDFFPNNNLQQHQVISI